MAIKFGEAEFGTLTKQEGTSVERPIPDVLPPWNPSPPHILTEDERAMCFGNLTPTYARLNQNSGAWEAVANIPATVTSNISLASVQRRRDHR